MTNIVVAGTLGFICLAISLFGDQNLAFAHCYTVYFALISAIKWIEDEPISGKVSLGDATNCSGAEKVLLGIEPRPHLSNLFSNPSFNFHSKYFSELRYEPGTSGLSKLM